MSTRSARERPAHRISGPAELIQAVPYLLGFHPAESLVLVGLRERMLSVTARMDLDDAGPQRLSSTVGALCRGGSDQLVGVVYGGGSRAARELAGVLPDVAEQAGCELVDLLHVAGGRYRSLLCEGDTCCPPEGRALAAAATPFAAAATVDGVVALPDRSTLEATLDPVAQADRLADDAIGAAESHLVDAAVRGRATRHRRALAAELLRAARASDTPGWTGSDDATAARLVAALADTAVRDQAWLAVDSRRVDGRPLWRDLARRAPGPYRAAPLLLFGWACYRAGNGTLAGMAADRAVAADPGYTAADLLRGALSAGVDPRRLPPLRLPSSA